MKTIVNSDLIIGAVLVVLCDKRLRGARTYYWLVLREKCVLISIFFYARVECVIRVCSLH